MLQVNVILNRSTLLHYCTDCLDITGETEGCNKKSAQSVKLQVITMPVGSRLFYFADGRERFGSEHPLPEYILICLKN